MRGRAMTAMLFVACGTSREAPTSAPAPPASPRPTTTSAPAPPAPDDAGPPPSSPLDALVGWVIANDVESLSVATADGVVARVTPDDGALCAHERCFAMPSIAAVRFVSETSMVLATREDPTRDVSGALSVADRGATFTARSTTAHVSPLGQRPPAPTHPARGRTTFAPRDLGSIAGLADALAPLDAPRVDVQTLHAGAARITLVTADAFDDARAMLLVRTEGGVARSGELLGEASQLVAVVGAGLEGPFTVVRVRTLEGRGWASSLWSLATEAGRVHVERVDLGGAEGYGEACDDERDGYCVWLTACERDLVVDDGTHAHLGPPLAWSAEHRRLRDRWIYGEPSEPHCPPAELVVTPHGLVVP